MHIAWDDIRNGCSGEIYYTKGTTTGLSGVIIGFVTEEYNSLIASATVELCYADGGGLLCNTTTYSKGYYEFV